MSEVTTSAPTVSVSIRLIELGSTHSAPEQSERSARAVDIALGLALDPSLKETSTPGAVRPSKINKLGRGGSGFR